MTSPKPTTVGARGTIITTTTKRTAAPLDCPRASPYSGPARSSNSNETASASVAAAETKTSASKTKAASSSSFSSSSSEPSLLLDKGRPKTGSRRIVLTGTNEQVEETAALLAKSPTTAGSKLSASRGWMLVIDKPASAEAKTSSSAHGSGFAKPAAEQPALVGSNPTIVTPLGNTGCVPCTQVSTLGAAEATRLRSGGSGGSSSSGSGSTSQPPRRELQARVRELEEALRQCQANTADLEARIRDRETDMRTLCSRLDYTLQCIAERDAVLKQLHEERDHLRAMITDTREHATRYEAERDRYEAERDALWQRLQGDPLWQQLQDVKADLRDAQEHIAAEHERFQRERKKVHRLRQESRHAEAVVDQHLQTDQQTDEQRALLHESATANARLERGLGALEALEIEQRKRLRDEKRLRRAVEAQLQAAQAQQQQQQQQQPPPSQPAQAPRRRRQQTPRQPPGQERPPPSLQPEQQQIPQRRWPPVSPPAVVYLHLELRSVM